LKTYLTSPVGLPSLVQLNQKPTQHKRMCTKQDR